MKANAASADISESEAPLKSLKVRAIQNGYFGDGPLGAIHRTGESEDYEGDIFTIYPREIPWINPASGKAELDKATGKLKTQIISVEQQFSSAWMVVVSDDEPERLTTAQKEIDRQVKELNSRGRPRED
jgi:hypothetical protein